VSGLERQQSDRAARWASDVPDVVSQDASSNGFASERLRNSAVGKLLADLGGSLFLRVSDGLTDRVVLQEVAVCKYQARSNVCQLREIWSNGRGFKKLGVGDSTIVDNGRLSSSC